MAVGEDDVRPQLDRVAQAIVGSRRAFGEPRLDLLRRAIHLEQAGLCEGRDYVRGSIAARVPVEGLGIGPQRNEEA